MVVLQPRSPSVLVSLPCQVVIPVADSGEPMRRPGTCVPAQLSSSSTTSANVLRGVLTSDLGKSHNGCSHVLLHFVKLFCYLLLRWPSGAAKTNLWKHCPSQKCELRADTNVNSITAAWICPVCPPHRRSGLRPALSHGSIFLEIVAQHDERTTQWPLCWIGRIFRIALSTHAAPG